MTTRRQFLTLGFWAIVPAAAPGLLAGCSAEPVRLRIAAGDEGGIYVAFARLLATRLEERVDGLEVEVQTTGGTQDNYERVSRGEADLGLGLADSVAVAVAADRRDQVRTLARTYENYLQLVVAADGPVRTVADLAGRRATLGAAGSGAAVTGAVLMRAAGLGTSGPRGVRVLHSGLAPSLEQLERGDTDAVLWSGGIPTPALRELDERFPLRMLDLGALVPAMTASSGYRYVERRVPRVSYAPERWPATTVGVPNYLIARRGLAADMARTVVEVLTEDAARLMPEFALGLQYLTPGLMIQTSPIPLHPGAVEAYRHLHG